MIIFLNSFLVLLGLNLAEVRTEYISASKSAVATEEFFLKMEKVELSDSYELIAYKGAAYALKGRYSEKVEVRMTFFRQGVEWIEYAIDKAPDNIELRLIRLSVQENSPKITGYKENLSEDKVFITSHLQALESGPLKKVIVDFILQSTQFTDSEKEAIRNQP